MSSASLRSARVYSIVVMVLGYVGFSFVWQHQQRLVTLSEARQAMAQIIVASNASGQFRGSADAAESAIAELIRASTGGGSFSALGDVEEETRRNPDNGNVTVDLRVRRRGGGQWGVADVSQPAGADAINRVFQRNFNSLLDVAAQVGLFESPDADVSELYVQIEQRTLGTEVTVPGVGLGFRGMQVVWVCVFATFGFLVILRDRVQHVLADEDLAASERWLVVDGKVGIEYALSQLWLLALFISPIALSSGLTLGVTAQIAADGATSTLAMDFLMTAGILVLMTGNGWLALNTSSRILELRTRRLALAVD